MPRNFVLISFVLALTACTTKDGADWWHQDFVNYGKNYWGIPTYRLTPGDSKDSVRETISVKYEVIRDTKIKGHDVETWMYTTWRSVPGPDYIDSRTFVFFIDDKLADWNKTGDLTPLLAALDEKQAEDAPPKSSSGTGFAVSRKGVILTNEHVVPQCESIKVVQSGKTYPASVITADKVNDLALLQTDKSNTHPLVFSKANRPSLGSDVTVLGYPLQGLLASSLNVTTGVVSAQTGPGDDIRFIQISAPVQPGNSGGPVLDNNGHVVGLVVAKLNALRVAAHTGDIPQNVNFAIRASLARIFLEENKLTTTPSKSAPTMSTDEIVAQAQDAVFLVVCEN